MTTGTIISIIVGVAGIIATYLFTKLQMKKNRIDHYFINSYDIGKGLTDDFPEFALHFGDKVLSNNVMVLQGGFMNTGRNDVGKKSEIIEISIVLPKGCTVKAVKVSPSCKGLKVNSIIKDYSPNYNEIMGKGELGFEIDGIMKSQEWFNYTAIIETPEIKEDLYGQLDFEHRIKDTSLNNIYVGPEYKWRNNKKHKLKNIMYAIIIIGIILLWFFVQLFGDENAKNGSESFLYIGAGYVLLAIIDIIPRRWGRSGRIVHELLKNNNKKV